MMQPVAKGAHSGKEGSDELRDGPGSTLPAGRRPPRSRPASAHERVYQPAGRSAAPLVRGAGVAAPRPWRRPAAVPDYGSRRSDHPARARGTAGRAGAVPGGPGAAAGGGPPARRKKDPAIIRALEASVAPETAGDRMRGQKWVRSSLRRMSERLRAAGHVASPPTVSRLLKGLDYALHVNAKQVEARATHPDRNAQFAYIDEQRLAFAGRGQPVISVDTKKKELIGAFKNAGRAWSTAAEAVNVHDFPSDALGRAVPYGVYDLQHNRGTVYVGSSGHTAAFTATAIAQWWQTEGQARFPGAARS